AVALACVATGWLSASGLGLELLWPEHPAWTHYSLWIVVPVGAYAFVQFVRGYLDTPVRLPREDAQIRWVGLSALVAPLVLTLLARYMFLLRFVQEQVPIAFFLAISLGGMVMIWVAAVAVTRRLPGGRLFSVAVGCVLAGAAISTLSFPLLVEGM